MSVQHFAFTVFQHTNAGNPSDPNIGFWVCYQASDDGVTVSADSVPAPCPKIANPYPTLAAAQAEVATLVAAQKANNATTVDPGNNPADTQVYGPVFV